MTTSKKVRETEVEENTTNKKSRRNVEFISGAGILEFTNHLVSNSILLLETVETNLEPISSYIEEQIVGD